MSHHEFGSVRAPVIVEEPEEPRWELGPRVEEAAVLSAVGHHVGEVEKPSAPLVLPPSLGQVGP